MYYKGDIMQVNRITSIRLNPILLEQLDQAVKILHRNKNWIINHALQAYLNTIVAKEFLEEAKRQSLLASHAINPDEEIWEGNSDKTDWK